MQFTAKEIAEQLQGQVEGDGNLVITHPARIEEAGAGSISFIANPKYADFAYTTKASVLIVSKDFQPKEKLDLTLIKVDEAYSSFGKILQLFNVLAEEKKGIENPSFVHESAKIDDSVYIGAFVYVGKNVVIGKNSKIYPHTYIGDGVEIGNNTTIYTGVQVYHNCKIADQCILHSGVIIGGDGFGFAPQKDGSFQKVPQLGNVIIESNVEVGSNSTIDRATMGSTIIRKGVKLDNLVQIAHNVEIGENTVIAAQSGVSGSTRIGKNCMIGGQVGIVGHIQIADGTRINAQSGVSKSVKTKGKALNGAPAFDYKDSLRSYSIYRNLPELEKRISDLEKKKS